MPKRSTTPQLNELEAAFDVLQRLIKKNGGKDPLAVALGRRGGLKGGRTLSDSLTPEQRHAKAVRAARAVAANAAAANAPLPVVALDPELVGFFINDTRDQIGIIEQAVLRWERLPAGQAELAAAQVQAAQRGFHTIKGAGNSIGLTAVAQSVHEVEAFLEELAGKGTKGSKAITPSLSIF